MIHPAVTERVTAKKTLGSLRLPSVFPDLITFAVTVMSRLELLYVENKTVRRDLSFMPSVEAIQ